MPRKLTNNERCRLADPSTYARIDAAHDEAERSQEGDQLRAVSTEITAWAEGCDMRNLTGADAMAFMRLRAAFDAASIRHRDLVIALTARNLDSDRD